MTTNNSTILDNKDHLLRIALKKFNNFQTVSPEKILPNYLIDETYWSTK